MKQTCPEWVEIPEREVSRRRVAGIDIGSRTTKVVILEAGHIVAGKVVETGVDAEKSADKALAAARREAGLNDTPIAAVAGTGYGRVALSFADKTATELSCHAKGCHFINPSVRTVIDVGGQDSKVIHLDARGDIVDFTMNDKCAAGAGKFLEMAARSLELDLNEMSSLNYDSAQACSINSMCAVFAETEIISLLAKKRSPADIVAGINRAFATRIGAMAKRLGVRPPVVFVGGVAKNKGLAGALMDYLDEKFMPLAIDSQLTGALGAAVLAQQILD